MPEPRPRSPAQSEASRRNGARSHGPVTPEGKAKASRNALKHGLCAMRHLVLEDEVPDDLEALIAHLTEEVGAASEIEARLARRLAIAFWKGERAERIEVALFDAAPKIRPPAREVRRALALAAHNLESRPWPLPVSKASRAANGSVFNAEAAMAGVLRWREDQRPHFSETTAPCLALVGDVSIGAHEAGPRGRELPTKVGPGFSQW